MKFDLSSFLLGYGAGATTVFLGKRLRPLLLELATMLYRFSDSVMAKAAMKQEDLEDLLAEARARAHRHTEPTTAREQAQA
ncbi:hypothetical protein [Vitiosangium sp. GDMCC 1.1324]|uniref:hypothetical protein n=1 Tax=Vitiosangium sp. (strain GDMCC 1.1324) TaxID=2138576 RepID=UPI000D3D9644|nr:hypothetical protein [Vitiosangium sp. GDMCC 1.1324]PTL81735.1 hypothetical protein DAT35_22610 [Vitiosangium sp. GDMCC 1.1324]